MGKYNDDANKHRKQGFLYVNSGTGMSLDKLDDILEDELNSAGRVDLVTLRRNLDDPLADIAGAVAIRSKIEEITGRSNRQSRRITKIFENEGHFRSWEGIPVTSVNSLETMAQDHIKKATLNCSANLPKKNRQSKNIILDVSSGSTDS